MSDTIDQIPEIPAGASPVAPGTLAKGVPFDPARHIPRTNPKTGAWMPKGGRKPKTAAPSSGSTSSPPAPTEPATSANSSPSPAGSPGASVKIDDLIPLADAPKPAPAPGAPAQPPQPGPAPIPDVGPSDAPAGNGTPAPGAAPAPGRDVNMGHEAAGELAARVVYSVTGAVTGNHKAATATGDEHKNIKSAFAAFFAHRGVAFVGGVALVLVIVAYALGEGRKEGIFGAIRKFTRRNESPVVDVETTPVPPPSPAPDAPRPAPQNAFFGR